MNGLDNVLNKLADGLDINNKALQSLYEVIGGNFEKVYSKLATEYSIYVVSRSFFLTSIIISIASLFIMVGVWINSSGFSEVSSTEKKALKVLCTILCISVGIVFLSMLTPLLYPNLSLILSVLNRLGGK